MLQRYHDLLRAPCPLHVNHAGDASTGGRGWRIRRSEGAGLRRWLRPIRCRGGSSSPIMPASLSSLMSVAKPALHRAKCSSVPNSISRAPSRRAVASGAAGLDFNVSSSWSYRRGTSRILVVHRPSRVRTTSRSSAFLTIRSMPVPLRSLVTIRFWKAEVRSLRSIPFVPCGDSRLVTECLAT